MRDRRAREASAKRHDLRRLWRRRSLGFGIKLPFTRFELRQQRGLGRWCGRKTGLCSLVVRLNFFQAGIGHADLVEALRRATLSEVRDALKFHVEPQVAGATLIVAFDLSACRFLAKLGRVVDASAHVARHINVVGVVNIVVGQTPVGFCFWHLLERTGAHDFVLTSKEGALDSLAGHFDVIVDTISAEHDVNAPLNCLRRDGTFVMVGASPTPFQVATFPLIFGRRKFMGSLVGGLPETQEMLDHCGTHGITSDIEKIVPDQINDAYERALRGDVRYRFVIDCTKF